MCGIVGRVGRGNRTEDSVREILSKQLQSISFRGPDSNDIVLRDEVAFGHTRLSIIDLSLGSQPMASSDGRFLIVFNGEIYNYIELRDELEREGVRFRTRSDTEVLIEAFRKWGEKVPEKLNGMFAYALYDFSEKTLFCARDPYGQKPFFYTVFDGAFYFGSEARIFKFIPGFSPQVDAGAIAQYLSAESFYQDSTIYKGVKKLEPGHLLKWKNETLTLGRYYKSTPAPSRSLSMGDAVEEVDSQLQRAVELAVRADVPVGILLSGGLDSSLVLAYFREALPRGRAVAFHARVDDPTYDESEYAKAAAKSLDVDLEIFNFGLKDLADLAKTVPTLLDEPQADPGILPKYFICREIAKSFKVALTGDGSDELFYGYLILKAQALAAYYRHVPGWMHKNFVSPIVQNLPTGSGYMRTDFLAKQFIRGFPALDALRASRWMRAFSESDLSSLFQDARTVEQRTRRNNDFLIHLWDESQGSGYLGHFAYQLQRTYLPDYVLCNSDRASMLNSLELRCPMLDMNLAALANSLPDKIKMPGLKTKFLLKKVAEKHLPNSVIYRKKIGFTVPMANLIRTTLRQEFEEVFSEKVLNSQGIFRYSTVKNLLDRHQSGKENLYKPLWTLYSLQKWLIHHGIQ